MKLTSFTDYSLRVLMYLALDRHRLATIQEIAQAYAISENHLMKVVHTLARNGLVESVRGKGGGVRLARDPERIVIGQVVREAEGDAAPVICFSDGNACCITPQCQLAGVLAGAFAAFYAHLDAYTLADLLRQPAQLARLLKLDR
ncbi:MAG: Rrf2 family transcriptional regulator [Rhodocyclaceae bacterium]